MKLSKLAAVTIPLAAGACSPKASDQPMANNVMQAPNSSPPATAAATAVPEPRNEAQPGKPGSLPEPKGPIDPKSVEAAGQIVQHYGALIEQGRFGEAEKLWGDAKTAAAFTKGLHPQTHLEIGDLGPTEGAAGSIYTTVPVVFYGDAFRTPADVILRRVNDVPGSTEAQRRWHIERIELKPAS